MYQLRRFVPTVQPDVVAGATFFAQPEYLLSGMTRQPPGLGVSQGEHEQLARSEAHELRAAVRMRTLRDVRFCVHRKLLN